MKMQGVAVIFLFLGMFISGSSGSNSTEFLVKLELKKKTCPDSVFMMKNVPTSLTCSSICASDVDCKSFFYFPTSLRCDGCKQTYSTHKGLKEVVEPTVFYIMAAHLSTTSAVTTTSTTTTEVQVTDLVVREGYRHLGCYTMPCLSNQGNCVQRDRGNLGDEATEELCMEKCHEWLSGVGTFALKEKHCFCDLQYEVESPGVCSIPCPGNPQQVCGGPESVSTFKIMY